jgi:hypothetical protein
MTRSALIAAVKIKIDELVPENELSIVSSGNEFINTINETIDSLINESAIEILKTAPIYYLPQKQFTGEVTVSDEVGRSIMPKDFLRLAYAKFTAWGRIVFTPIEVGSKEWLIQQNEYSRAKYKKPVIAQGKKHAGIELEFYTIKEADKGSKDISYIPYPVNGESITEENDTLPIAMQWLLTSKVLQIFKSDAYKVAYEQYLNTLK